MGDYPPEDRGRTFFARFVGLVVTVVRLVCGFAAAVLALHVLLTIGDANPNNGITRFVTGAADVFALGFHDLFTPADPGVAVVVNYGLAMLFWLIVAGVVSSLLRRLTSPYLIS